jgi:hypothetical protein
MVASPLNRDAQSSWLRIATGTAPGAWSPAEKSRPTAGVTPSIDRKFQVISADRTGPGSPRVMSVCDVGPE